MKMHNLCKRNKIYVGRNLSISGPPFFYVFRPIHTYTYYGSSRSLLLVALVFKFTTSAIYFIPDSCQIIAIKINNNNTRHQLII